jgi:hypothetical protein
MTQKWKTDESLYAAPTEVNGEQINKKLDYETVYVKEFLDCDPLRDWESIDRCIWLWEWAINQIIDWDGESIVKTMMDWKVLDVGTKDGQFVDYLGKQQYRCIGYRIFNAICEVCIGKRQKCRMG